MGRRRAVNTRPNEPPCYDCLSAVRRGNFRLCRDGEEGYKHIGEWSYCPKQKPIPKD